MTNPDTVNLPVKKDNEIAEQKFQQMDLKELGLQPEDFQEVLAVRKELQEMSHNAVAEYGKNIASKTATYTDELLNLVQNRDLDTTGQKLNQVVQVAQQLNASSILSKNKPQVSWVICLINSKVPNRILILILIPPKNRLMYWLKKLRLHNLA